MDCGAWDGFECPCGAGVLPTEAGVGTRGVPLRHHPETRLGNEGGSPGALPQGIVTGPSTPENLAAFSDCRLPVPEPGTTHAHGVDLGEAPGTTGAFVCAWAEGRGVPGGPLGEQQAWRGAQASRLLMKLQGLRGWKGDGLGAPTRFGADAGEGEGAGGSSLMMGRPGMARTLWAGATSAGAEGTGHPGVSGRRVEHQWASEGYTWAPLTVLGGGPVAHRWRARRIL